MPGENELTAKQLRAIAVLLSAATVYEAAVALHVHERTLRRWLAEPAFRAELRAAEDAAIDAATRRLIGVVDGSIEALIEVRDDEQSPAHSRVRAAQVCLETLVKLRELRDIESRLAALEEAFSGKAAG